MRRETSQRHRFRIAIVDDHALVRDGLRQCFAEQPGIAVVAEAGNGRDALYIVSERELQVLKRLARGETVGVNTVCTHRTQVTEKMGLASNRDLRCCALKDGLIQ